MESTFSRRQFTQLSLASGAGFLAAGPQSAQANTVWQVVEHDGLEYVTHSSVRVFYRFLRFLREGNDLLFRNQQYTMKWRVGAKVIFINSIKFVLSFPVIEKDGKVLISRTDLQKLMDPVLRPIYIKDAESFNTVTIDAGHGGHDPGGKSKYGVEKDFALTMARQLRDAVKARGLAVKMTRDSDTYLSLPQRVKIANEVDRSIFVSVHFNSGTDPTATGIETYALTPQGTGSTNDGAYSEKSFEGNQQDSENIALATAVHAMVMSKISIPDRGIKRARYNVLVGIKRPAILFEGGFMTHPNESRRIASESYRRELADAIAGGITTFRKAIQSAIRV